MMQEDTVDLGALARERNADQSDSIAELAAALAKAQGQMENASKDSKNPHFNSKFADLAATWDAIRKPLADNGLAVMQRVRPSATGVAITSHLVHSSGQWVKDTMDWPVAQRTPQGIGSAITYGKRYALQALVGVASEDDDGEAATRAPAPRGVDAVRAAVSKAPKLAPVPAPKASKPEPIPATGNMEVAMRFSTLWETAKKAGYKAHEFKEFGARILGEDKPSSALTVDDVGALESAWSAEVAQ